MRALDLCSGAGGAAKGYANAGLEVVGVDIKPQPNFPYKFIQMDALEFLLRLIKGDRIHGYSLEDFDVIHVSPPCQAYSLIAAGGVRRKADHPKLIEGFRLLLQVAGLPYVIENVPQAPLINPVHMCSTQFGLPIIRHRSFECSFPAVSRMCHYKPTARVRHKGYLAYPYGRKSWEPAWREHVLPVVWPWMTLAEAGEAIPPDYTHELGKQLIAYLNDSHEITEGKVA